MGNNSFATIAENPLCFRVTNTHPEKNTIIVFNCEIKFGETLDFMQQRGIGEENIKSSLLKGELKYYITKGYIVVECSDIDLITFNAAHKAFLSMAGIDVGVSVMDLDFAFKQNCPLIGVQDGRNQIYTTAEPFIYGQHGQHFFRPTVHHNGAMKIGGIFADGNMISGISAGKIDYVVQKSSISMQGNSYDTIRFISFTPVATSKLTISYSTTPN